MPNIGDRIIGRSASGMTHVGFVVEFVFGWCRINSGGRFYMVDFRGMA